MFTETVLSESKNPTHVLAKRRLSPSMPVNTQHGSSVYMPTGRHSSSLLAFIIASRRFAQIFFLFQVCSSPISFLNCGLLNVKISQASS